MLSFALFAHNVKQTSSTTLVIILHKASLHLSDIHSAQYHEADSFFVLVMGKSSKQREMSLARYTTSIDTCKHNANTTLQIGVYFSKRKCVYTMNCTNHPKCHMTVYLFNMPTKVANQLASVAQEPLCYHLIHSYCVKQGYNYILQEI